MKKEKTFKDILDRIDGLHRTPDGLVVFHPNLPYNHITLKEEFIDQLRKELNISINMHVTGIDNLNATTKFAIMMIENAF